ncbi:uncharacterized protein LOC121829376 [Peromyscus maniculatus bairdii]|uniref:uncharacterized protein LOC121829376 n=1 Tax=Peromyscus maniculatus bairdii TaxID=230844 RepID=UPI003FD3AB62
MDHQRTSYDVLLLHMIAEDTLTAYHFSPVNKDLLYEDNSINIYKYNTQSLVFQSARIGDRGGGRRGPAPPNAGADHSRRRARAQHAAGARVARAAFSRSRARPGLQPLPARPRPSLRGLGRPIPPGAPTRSRPSLPGRRLTSQPDPEPSQAGPRRTRAAKTETAPGSALSRLTQSASSLPTAARGYQKEKMQAGQWWCSPLIPALGRQSQANLCEFEAILNYKMIKSLHRALLNNRVNNQRPWEARVCELSPSPFFHTTIAKL